MEGLADAQAQLRPESGGSCTSGSHRSPSWSSPDSVIISLTPDRFTHRVCGLMLSPNSSYFSFLLCTDVEIWNHLWFASLVDIDPYDHEGPEASRTHFEQLLVHKPEMLHANENRHGLESSQDMSGDLPAKRARTNKLSSDAGSCLALGSFTNSLTFSADADTSASCRKECIQNAALPQANILE